MAKKKHSDATFNWHKVAKGKWQIAVAAHIIFTPVGIAVCEDTFTLNLN